MNKKTFKEYFNIDPKYYSAVTADLIKTNQVKWNSFYPHETFVKLLQKTHIMLSGKDSRSLWVEGAYGTGKSHAVLTIKSILEASDKEVREYFDEFGLSNDLCEQLITDKSNGKLITIHRIGSASIRSDQDLILALQDSISTSLKEHGIENRGELALKDATLKWFNEKEANRVYFDTLIQEEKYMWDFGGKHVDKVIDILNNGDIDEVYKMMRNILTVAEDNGITALRLDIPAMCEWIKNIIEKNELTAILFVWDEFTEYFINNQNSLTGFQTLAEISESHPFYFLIVTHESSSLIKDNAKRKKILNRFVGDVTVRIDLPENMAFRLMAQAMKENDDPVLYPEWIAYKADLNRELTSVRNNIISSVKKYSTMGQNTCISDNELQGIVPIHPYAALLLKHMSVAFNSNARSMFDFIISNDMEDAKGFKWFINNYGPLDSINLLTIDMLWEFFNGKDQNGLNDDVRVILDSYSLLKKDCLLPEQERVFKTILLLEAISLRVHDIELLRPNEQNIDLAFSGTDWAKGKARNIAVGLCQQGLIFEKPVGNGMKEYTVANNGSDRAQIESIKGDIVKSIKTKDLIISGDILSSVQLPSSIRSRFILNEVTLSNFAQEINKFTASIYENRIKMVVSFALNEEEAECIKDAIRSMVCSSSNELFYVECLTPMGEDLYQQYVENMAYSKSYLQNDRKRASGFESQANRCLNEWKNKISKGAFILYTPEKKNGFRLANLNALQDELQRINHQIYYCGLEQYRLVDNMFTTSQLAVGAECGIKRELKNMYRKSSESTSLDTALKEVWKVERYWEKPELKSLPIVRVKLEVERLIKAGFEKGAGRISIYSLYEALEKPPFGFMPLSITAFVMGFVLKEYTTSDYFWSNNLTSEVMSVNRMKQMISNALNHKVSPNTKYREEYIVAMSIEHRSFLQCTAEVFNIPIEQCSSVENARDQVRSKMKGLVFPIWCLKSILKDIHVTSSVEDISDIIDSFCGIANNANSNKDTESELAERIGTIVNRNKDIQEDLKKLFTNTMCRKGMITYIDTYSNGDLRKLATKVDDGGAYIEEVKQKFNSDAANWVWNISTANEKISDVILDYRIILETNKSVPKCSNINEVVNEWNKRSNNIRIPFEILKRYVGDLKVFLAELNYMKQSGKLQEQSKKTFYHTLLIQRENFEDFYKEQFTLFKQILESFLEGLEDIEVREFYNGIAPGQFTKSGTEYFNYIEKNVEEFKKGLKKNKLKKIWNERTQTKDPFEWSEKYMTPILCMFNDNERSTAKEFFGIMSNCSASDVKIEEAIKYFENATFYGRLCNQDERDKCFLVRVIGNYDVMLGDVNYVREKLRDSLTIKVYDWIDNSQVNNKLKILAEKQYKLSGYERAQAIIDQMNATELRHYLNELIADNITVGIEIIKNE